MATEHRFKDEWLARLAIQLPGVPPEFIGQVRAAHKPYLAQALIAAGFIRPEDIGRAVQQAYRIEFVQPAPEDIDRTAVRLVPERVCRNHLLMPIRADDRSINLAMANPLDLNAESDVRSVTGRRPTPFYCPPARIEDLIARLLTPDKVIFDLLKHIEAHEPIELISESATDRGADAQEPIRDPVVRLVDAILAKAVQLGASDIHVEQDEKVTHVRYRIDGLLRSSMVLPRYLGVGPVVSRIKIMAKLDVADRLKPQDGRAKIRIGGATIGLRVSTLPTPLGEKVVVRILDERSALIPLERLGLDAAAQARLERIVSQDQGMLLVTGPTGSGKTTTLYAVLNTLASEDTNVVTVEDPIEYRLPGANQVQVNEKQGLTFASVLRSVLRQDPDVILVGEIRDRETADIACQASLTGHLVLSTLHTNDALTSIVRLADMGVDRYKISAGVTGIAAQRLVRRLCPACRQALPAERIPAAMRRQMARRSIEPRAFATGGCGACGFSGYRGRVALFELLEITPSLREHVAAGAALPELRRRALESGALHTMSDDALLHVAHGDCLAEDALPHVDQEPVPAPPPAITAAAPAPAARPGASTARVLVALQDDEARSRVSVALAAHGHTVEDTNDGLQALIALAQRPPDLLVTGLALPGLDGVEIIRRARSVLALTAMPILAVAGELNPAGLSGALEAGATDGVTAMLSAEELALRVGGLLEQRGDYSPTADVMRPRIPADEDRRLAALRATGLLDTPPEDRFDTITHMARELFHVPIALVSFVDENRQWFKSRDGLEATETPRDVAFCAHAINDEEVFVVPDAELDARFADNPLVRGEPHVRFYAGYPLNGPGGEKLGTLCIVDRKPRQMSASEIDALRNLGRLIEHELRA